jgi:phenylacetate-CoA ligase
LVPLEYRLGGKNFINTYNQLKISENWSKEKLKKYQEKELEKLLKHAVKNIPFYSEIKLTSSDPFKNLEKFPIIEKDFIKENIKKFIAKNISEKNVYHTSTGGTSGRQLEFFLDNNNYGKEWAFIITAWERVGFKLGDKIVSLRGVEFKKADKGIFWQDNPIYNMIEFSPFHLTEKNLQKYVEKIIKIKPKYIHGYPSAITILANYVAEKNIKFPQIDAVLAISENVYPHQRKIIERIFKTRLFSFYGLSERVIMAPECEYDTRYHSFPEYGITEILDNKDNHVSEGERGELVGTGFLNYYMPFIRYRTGDYATISKQQSCKCGRNHLLLANLVGRTSEELIVGVDGALMSFAALNLHSDILKNVYQYQFVQLQEGELTINIVPMKNFSNKDEEKIKDAFYKKVGKGLIININLVDKIPLTKRGKFKLLIQNLKLKK